MSDQALRSKAIRLASTMPVGSAERKALLEVLTAANTLDPIAQISAKLLHHRDLRALSPRKQKGSSGQVFIYLSSGRDKAVLQMAPWKDGVGWSLVSKGKLYGEGELAVGGEINSVLRPVLAAVKQFESTIRPLFG